MELAYYRNRLEVINQMIDSADLLITISHKEWQRCLNYTPSTIKTSLVKYYAAKNRKYIKVKQRLERYYLQVANRMLSRNNAAPVSISAVEDITGLNMVHIAEAHANNITPINN